ncbi:hypothetical protein C8R43DRAFT_818005, partial [Mycena crocata]
HSSPSVHNFAFLGATAEENLAHQLTRFFDQFPRKCDAKSAPALDAETTYFVFIGINDCGSTAVDELEPIVESVLDALHDLYTKAGGRKFVIIDVPPINRSPSGGCSSATDSEDGAYCAWNETLREHALKFGNNSNKVAVHVFSAHQVLSEILDDPSEFEFSVNDPTDEGGAIWEDDLHLT